MRKPAVFISVMVGNGTYSESALRMAQSHAGESLETYNRELHDSSESEKLTISDGAQLPSWGYSFVSIR